MNEESSRDGEKNRRISLSFWAIAVVGLALLVLNVALQRRNSQMETSLAELERSRGPQPGVVIQEIVGETPSGAPITLHFNERTLVLAMSARCKPCSENWPAWREVVSSLPSGAQVVYADVTDSVNDRYLANFAIPAGRVITRIDFGARWRYDLRETPETIVVAAGGKVEKVWKGRLSAKDIIEAKSAF